MKIEFGKPIGSTTPIYFLQGKQKYADYLLNWFTPEQRTAAIKRKTEIAEKIFAKK